MINDIIKDMKKARKELDSMYLSVHEVNILYEYIMSINEVIEKQSDVIKKLILRGDE